MSDLAEYLIKQKQENDNAAQPLAREAWQPPAQTDVNPTFRTTVPVFGSEWSYRLNPSLATGMAPMGAYSMRLLSSNAATTGLRGFVDQGGFISMVGAGHAVLDALVFSDCYRENDQSGMLKYGSALLADVGMMAPLAGALLSKRAPVLGTIAGLSCLTRSALYLVPDKITEIK